MNGILVIHKEKGFTSHDVVAKLRGILKQKRIGHTGTLDPDATGVLPVLLGNATRLSDEMTGADKVYRTVMRFGIETDTQDLTGTVLKTAEVPSSLKEETVGKIVQRFCGEIQQVPPMYSAVSIGGRKLYSLAREGKTVERPARAVTVYSLQIERYDPVRAELEMTVHCSKGTYIRTLCHDIGQAAGCGAAMASLVRLRSGSFTLEESLTLEEAAEAAADGRLVDLVLPTERFYAGLPVLCCRPEADRRLKNGACLEQADGKLLRAEGTDGDKTSAAAAAGDDPPAEEASGEAGMNLSAGDRVRVHDSAGVFQAVYRWDEQKQVFRPDRMFLTP